MTENYDKAIIEIKTQTIIYETDNDKMGKFFYHGSNQITASKASEILKHFNIYHRSIIRVIAERVEIEINRLDYQDDETIVSRETYYKRK